MTQRTIWRRMRKLEKRFMPVSSNGFTLEELCRSVWREDQTYFREFAAESTFPISILIPQFEREDADRARRAQR